MIDEWNEILRPRQDFNAEVELMAPYIQYLLPYGADGKPENENFFKENSTIGYKFHLNVLPVNVVQVSEFLKAHGYSHKFLSGGDIELGKIFTVYSGSKLQTERIVQEVSDGISSMLEEPKDMSEVLFAPRIVGRFRGEKQFFHQYGKEGISLLNDMPLKDSRNTPERAQARALQLYGAYYGGGIKYYEPGTPQRPVIHNK